MTQPEVVYVSDRNDLGGMFILDLIRPDVVYIDKRTQRAWKFIGNGFTEVHNAAIYVYPGDKFFNLKATHGLPLEDAVAKIHDGITVVDWIGFIVEARKNGWLDFQTLQVVQETLVDMPGLRKLVIHQLKQWIMQNKLTEQ